MTEEVTEGEGAAEGEASELLLQRLGDDFAIEGAIERTFDPKIPPLPEPRKYEPRPIPEPMEREIRSLPEAVRKRLRRALGR